jgi:cytochrome P450 family 9
MGAVALRILSFPDSVVDLYNRLKGHKYGGVYEFMNPVLLLRDPELIKMVTVKDFEYFLDHRTPIDEEAEPLFGKGLFNLRGKFFIVCTLLLLIFDRCKTLSSSQSSKD